MQPHGDMTDRTNEAPGANAYSAPASAPASSNGFTAPVTDRPGTTASGANKADLGKRAIAVVIDAVLAMVVGMIPVIGGLVAAAYWLVRDGLEVEFMDRRSLGKKIMKLRPVRLDGQPMDIATSVRRNWMFALGGIVSLLLFIPIIGWLLMIPVALVAMGLGIFEIYKVVTDDQGRRLGDTMAGTKVIEVDA